MPQQINIIKGQDASQLPENVLPELDGEVTAIFIPSVTNTGKSAVMFSVVSPAGEKVITLTCRNFMGLVGAVRGWMIESGEIPVKVDPGLAMSVTPGSGKVHFCMEAAIHEWDFTTAEAKKFWRILRDMAEESGKR